MVIWGGLQALVWLEMSWCAGQLWPNMWSVVVGFAWAMGRSNVSAGCGAFSHLLLAVGDEDVGVAVSGDGDGCCISNGVAKKFSDSRHRLRI